LIDGLRGPSHLDGSENNSIMRQDPNNDGMHAYVVVPPVM
jgi:hypothetical protein